MKGARSVNEAAPLHSCASDEATPGDQVVPPSQEGCFLPDPSAFARATRWEEEPCRSAIRTRRTHIPLPPQTIQHSRQAPNDAVIDLPPDGYIPSPQAYGPPPGYEDAGVQVDNNGWSGGVGYGGDGGGGGGAGFVDGFGQVHFGNGGSVENGPTYNNYGQSFQYNPSQAGPFQPRLMGGFAPAASK